MPGKDASGRTLNDRAVRVLEAVSRTDGEATVTDITEVTGDSEDDVLEELSALVRSGHLAGSPRAEGEAGSSFGLLPAGRAALRLS